MEPIHIIPLCILSVYIGKYINNLFSEKVKNPDLHINRKVKYIFNGQELTQPFLTEYLVMLEYNSTQGLTSLDVAIRWGWLTQKYGWTSKTLEGNEFIYQPLDYFNARSYLIDYCEYMNLN